MANSQSFLRTARVIISYGDVEAFEVTDLRIRFEVTKLKPSTGNTMKLTIYNLDPRAHPIAAKPRKVGTGWRYGRVKLFAGYESESGLLFLGDIKNVNTRRDGADIITDIYALDGGKATENAHMSQTFTAGASLLSQLDAGFSSMSKADPTIIKAPYQLGTVSKKKNVGSRSIFSDTRSFIDALAREYGFGWSIHNNTFRVSGHDDVFKSEAQAQVISKTTGMIGAPAITEKGATVKSLLLWDIAPDDPFRVESEYGTIKLGVDLFRNQTYKTLGEGYYKVLSVKHVGDTRGNTWFSNIEGIDIKNRLGV